jgi:hypothetical protein
LAAVWLCASVLPAQAGTWLKAESPHFIVYGDAKEKSVRDYTAMLEDYDALLRVFHGRKVDEPVTSKLSVYLVSNINDFHRIYPDAQKGIIGMYWVSDEDIFAVATRDASNLRGGDGGDDIVMHEYAHHFMAQYYANGYPPWYIEGYAEYFATSDLGKKLTIGNISEGRAYGLMNRPWIPIAEVLTRSTSEMSDAALEAYYAEAWLLTHYVMDDLGRRQALQNYIVDYRAGRGSVESWKRAFGDTPEVLQNKLRDYTRGHVMGAVLERTWPPPAITITKLSPGAGEVLLETQFLKRRASTAPSPALLKTVKDAAAKYPADRAVQMALARAHLLTGERAAGEAVLRDLIKADPADAEALRTLASSIMDAAGNDSTARRTAYLEAKPLMAEAIKADPQGYQTLNRFAQSRSTDADYLSDETVNALLKAIKLAPQVPGMRLNLAQIAIIRHSPDLARTLLQPVANNPHEQQAAKAAQAMLDSIAPAGAAQAKP